MDRKIIFPARLRNYSLGFVLFLLPFGIFFVAFDKLPGSFSFLHSIMIFLYALILFLWTAEERSVSFAVKVFLAVSLSGFAAEYWGVKTGFLFGSYQYTNVLGFKWMGVPLAIPLAWYVTVTSSAGLFLELKRSWMRSVCVAFAVLALDIVLEPMAAFIRGFWVWHQDQIPWSNYVCWLALAFSLSFVMDRSPGGQGSKQEKGAPVIIYGMQWILFAVTDCVHGYWVPVLLSLALLTVLERIRIHLNHEN